MGFLFFNKKDAEISKDTRLNEVYANLKASYPEVLPERKEKLSKLRQNLKNYTFIKL